MTQNPSPTPLRRRRVPLRVEAQRFGITAWQLARGGGELLLSRKRGTDVSRRAAGQTRRRFEALGPTYVKLGQLIASSPGVFPDVLADEFRNLLDQVPPVEPAAIAQTLTAELGAPPEELFAHFDAVPIASASIAQVHTATLRTGERVVVKVQRPGITKTLAADTRILTRVARLAEFSEYGRIVGTRDIIDDFAANLEDELDFRREAEAMREWREALSDSAFADKVRVPTVHTELTTAKVLVMEFVEAVRIDDVEAIAAAGHDGTEIIKTILLSLMESAFRRGLFHGDLHAGNVLIDQDGKVVFLDWGIVGRFDDQRRVVLRRLVGDLLVYNDFEAASRAMVELGAIRRPGGRERAAADIRSVTAPLAGAELATVSYTDLAKRFAELGRAYQLRVPRELVLVGKQLLYVERYMKLLAPTWKPIADEDVVTFMAELIDQAETERALEESA